MAKNVNPNVGKQKKQKQHKGSNSSSTKTAAAITKKERISTQKPDAAADAPMFTHDYDEGRFMKGTDMELGTEEEVIIERLTNEMLGDEGSEKKKPCAWFKDLDGQKIEKGLVLNKTNRDVLAEAYGTDMRRWPSHRAVLYPQMVPFKGKPVQSMRLRPPMAEGQRWRGKLASQGLTKIGVARPSSGQSSPLSSRR